MQEAMAEWAALPAQEAAQDAKVAEKAAKDAQAEEIAKEYEGAQSSLVFDKDGKVQSEKSKIARVDENGHIRHLNKIKVNNAADKVEELKGYDGDTELTPNQAVPALRNKRIAEIEGQLNAIAQHAEITPKNGERDDTGVARARELRKELLDLKSRAHVESAAGAREAVKAARGEAAAPAERPKGGWDELAGEVATSPEATQVGEALASVEAAAEAGAENPFGQPPKMTEREVRTFLDADGQPVVGFKGGYDAKGKYHMGLDDVMAQKVLEGDASDWNNLVQTLRDVVKFDAEKRGNDVGDRVKTFEKYASGKYKELMANKAAKGTAAEADPTEEVPVKMKRRQRAKAALFGVMGRAQSREHKEGRKNALIVAGVLGAAAIYELLKYKLTGSWNPVRNWGGASEHLGAKHGSTLEDRPRSTGDNLPRGNNPRGNAPSNHLPERPRGNTPDGLPTPGANGESGGKVVFTVMEKYHDGAPTPWSWAESQGIPSNKVPGFLNEVMGPDWREAARGMQIGDSVSATAEQIAKYKG
jgi:hypothetical protein